MYRIGKSKSTIGYVITLLFCALLASGCIEGELNRPADAAAIAVPTFTPPSSPAQAVSIDDILLIDALGFDIAERRVIDVHERVAPSVVNITTRLLRRGFFFNVVPEEGAGSGFVLDKNGHILTNFHVIDGAERIEVGFSNDTIVPARVVGLDARNDIALLKVDVEEELLVPVELGNSGGLHAGQRAIAIGNPFGQFGRTLTTGVISAIDRTLEGADGRTIAGVIQTDAAINSGNSGGPLLDSSGRVIGINTAIFSPSGTNAGVGFAVPVATIKRILPDLLALGRYRHPWLGLRYAYSITPGLAETLKLPVDSGLLIVQLYEGSPMERAGVRNAQGEAVLGNQRVYVGGDILLMIDDVRVNTFEDMNSLLEEKYRVEDSVTITLLRQGERLTMELNLAEEPN